MSSLSLAAYLLFAGQAATVPPPPTPPALVTPADATERMDLARKVNGLHGMDIPWHLKATYEILEPDGTSSEKGVYEEWWVSDQQYRIAFHSPSRAAEEFGTDHGIFRTGDQPWPRTPLSAIRGLITNPVGPAQASAKTPLENYQRSFGADKLPCTAMRPRGASHPEQFPSFCFSPTNAILVYASGSGTAYQTVFEDIRRVHGQYLSYKIQRLLAGKPWLKIQVDSLAGLGNAELNALNVPKDATPSLIRLNGWEEDSEDQHVLHKQYPVYPEAAKQMGVQGTVVVNGVIDKDGHLTDLRVIAGPQMLQQAALDAVRQWVYKPYTQGGQPVELETDINVVFQLSR